MPAITAPSASLIGIPPAPGNTASGEQATNPLTIGGGSVRIRPRWTTLGSCCVAAIQAFEYARAIPPVPPRSIREADTSMPLAPTTTTAPRTPMSSALSMARATNARASASGRSLVCIVAQTVHSSFGDNAGMTGAGSNWAGSYAYRAARVHEPTTVEELQELVAAAREIRVLGTRHSFNDIADSAELVSLAGLPVDLELGEGTVTFGAGLRYGDLAAALEEHGLALHNLASLPHISVAGAVATATHGSGERNGNLATAVAALEWVGSDGELRRAARGEPDFDGLVVSLGAIGAITRVTLDVEPSYQVAQRVYEDLSWDALYANFDAIEASGYSVSLFTRFGATVDQVWVKRRDGEDAEELFGARAASGPRHMIAGVDPVHTTAQLGRPGPWSDRLAHFRMGFTPSNGEELQSEYLLPRSRALEAIAAMQALADRLRPQLQISEIRTVAADRLWMSPQYGRDTVGVHFTWRRDLEAVTALLEPIEAALLPLGGLPHWGKLFRATASDLAPGYERRADFLALVERLDPRGAFRNDWFEQRVA